MSWLSGITDRLKGGANRALDGFKKDILREIDRAVGKLESGQTTADVVDALHSAISELIAKARLPLPLGPILVSILLMVDWSGLSTSPAVGVLHTLKRLRKDVEGARL